MSERQVATLSVSFSEEKEEGVGDNAGENRIILQQMTKRLDSKGQLWARCFPSSGVTFTANVGTVTSGEVRGFTHSQSVKFSGSSSVSLNYPNVSNVVITPKVLMQKTKDSYGKTVILPASGINLRYDEETNNIVAERRSSSSIEEEETQEVSIYGACFVQYDTMYQMLYYKPGFYSTPVGGGSFATTFSVGTIFAYNNYDVQTLDMELDMSSSPNWVEFARVTSKIVLDAKGVWEFPTNWETTYQNNREKTGEQREDYGEPGRFSGFSDEIDPEVSFVDTRVHCVIEVNTTGTLRFNDYNNGGSGYWAWFAPYFGYFYNPKYELSWTDPPGGAKASNAQDFKYDLNHRTWRDVFLQVDKAELLEQMEEEYPGISARRNSR